MNSKQCSECGNRLRLMKNNDGSIICKTCYDELNTREIANTNDIEEANHICDHIFLGSEKCASDFNFFEKNNITKVLIIGKLIERYFESNPQMTYKQIEINDESTENIRQHFEECFAFIENRIKDNGEPEGNILIHCVAGVSRSATITIAYLMKRYSLTFTDSFNFVKQKRQIVDPNPGFQRQLKKFEIELKQNPKFKEVTHNYWKKKQVWQE